MTAPRMKRAERRAQLEEAATKAFLAADGFDATSLDDIAAAAGVSRMILYRHFDSKADIYAAALARATERLHTAATDDNGDLHQGSIPGLVDWAGLEPDGFRLLFRQAARDPRFSDEVADVRAGMTAALEDQWDESGLAPEWEPWAAQLSTTVVIEGILSWLDAGCPAPDTAADRILAAVDGVLAAASKIEN